jgi:nitroreductase
VGGAHRAGLTMEKQAAELDPRLHPLIVRRRSLRAFADRSVPLDVLGLLVEAARWAPSSFNDQPWAFFLARREEPDAFQKLASCLSQGNHPWASRAPVLGLSVARMRRRHDGQPNPHAWYDVGQAVAQMTLQAVAEGLVVHQMAGFDRERARAVHGIPPEWDPVAALAIGYPGDPVSLPDDLREKETRPRRRLPTAELAFVGHWGVARRG